MNVFIGAMTGAVTANVEVPIERKGPSGRRTYSSTVGPAVVCSEPDFNWNQVASITSMVVSTGQDTHPGCRVLIHLDTGI